MSRIRSIRKSLWLVVFALFSGAVESGAQTNIYLTAGNSLYSGDAFCLESGAFLSSFHAGIEGSLIGAEASFNNSDWPWPCPPGGCGGSGGNLVAFSGTAAAKQANFLTHGNAVAATLRVFPVAIAERLGLGEIFGTVDQYVRPHLGFGTQISTDGETAPPSAGQGLPTYAVKGRTDVLLTYGISALLPRRDTRFGVMVEYRGARTLADEIEIETDTGQTLTSTDNSISWGEFLVGLRLRLGS